MPPGQPYIEEQEGEPMWEGSRFQTNHRPWQNELLGACVVWLAGRSYRYMPDVGDLSHSMNPLHDYLNEVRSCMRDDAKEAEEAEK